MGRRHVDGAQVPAGGGVPEANRIIKARRGQKFAVGRETNRNDPALVSFELEEFPAGGGVPEPNSQVVSTGSELLAVRREGNVRYFASMPGDPADFLAGGDIPEVNHLLLVSTRGKHLAVGRKRQAADQVRLPKAQRTQTLDRAGG